MGLHVRRKRIKRCLNPIAVRLTRSCDAELAKPRRAESVVPEHAVQVTPLHPARRVTSPLRSAAKRAKGRARSGPSVRPIWIS